MILINEINNRVLFFIIHNQGAIEYAFLCPFHFHFAPFFFCWVPFYSFAQLL